MPTPTWGASLAALAAAISVNPPLLLIVISQPFWCRKSEYRRSGGYVKKPSISHEASGIGGRGARPPAKERGGDGLGARRGGIHAVDEKQDADAQEDDREDAQADGARQEAQPALLEKVLLLAVEEAGLD